MKLRPLAVLLLAVCALFVVQQAAAQDKFRDRHYRVRIAVNDGVDGLVLQCRGAYQVLSSTGAPLTQLANGQITFVQITRGKPGARTYRLVLREMDAHQVDAAIALARTAKDSYKLPVKVLRIPGKRPGESRIIVTLGEFQRLEEARDQIAKLTKERISYIYEDRSRAEQGQVRLVSREGTILARDPRFLKLSPLDVVSGDVAVQELDSGRWSPAAMPKARRYRGELELTINEEGLLTAVNDLWIEYYLYSVVAAEIGADAPDEALKAQAVAGRSEAVTKIERGIVSSSFFDFYDTSLFQTYRGKGDETERVRRAVDATRGEILVWREPGGQTQFVDSVYGHSCGGYVTSMNDMWDGQFAGYSVRRLDQLTPAKAPDLETHAATADFIRTPMPQACCNPNQPGFPNYARKYFRWKYTFTGAEFTRMADKSYGVGTVKNVKVEKRMPSGRVRAVRIEGSKKSVTIDRELDMRSALGDVESTLFVIGTSQDEAGNLKGVVIEGAGFGHGVGMCQMGAYMLGRRGFNYRQILGQYFQDVRIRRLYR